MTERGTLEERLTAALTRQAETAMAATDTVEELARFRLTRRRNRLRLLSSAAAAAAAAAIVGILLSTSLIGGRAGTGAQHQSRFPKPQALVAARPLPAGVVVSSPRLDATVAPELVVDNVLWSVQNAGADGAAYVLRSDVRTLRTISKVRFSTSFGHYQTTQLLRVGRVVVLPMQSYDPTGVASSARDAVLRFDAGSGRMLSPLFVASTGVDAATADGVFVQTDVTRLGLLDPSGRRVVRELSMPFSDAVVFASGRLWGYDENSSRIVGVDPSNGREVESLPLPGTSDVLLMPADASSVLVSITGADPGGPPTGVYRLDTRSLQFTGATLFGSRVSARAVAARGWAVDGTRLWAADGALLAEFDARSLKMLRSYTVATNGLNDTGTNAVMPIAVNRLFVSDSGGDQLRAFELPRLR